jgi:hypothetical protein
MIWWFYNPMLIHDAAKAKPRQISSSVARAIESVSEHELREFVSCFSVPRHYLKQAKANRESAQTLATLLKEWGYLVTLEGEFFNIVARPSGNHRRVQLVAAHFDSTPFTPGADDNASAVAAMLACAKAVAKETPKCPIMFVSFNREEDGLLGSKEFVKQLVDNQREEIMCAHVLEMVGYASDKPDSQMTPAGLPLKLPSTGNFLGLLANTKLKSELMFILQQAKTYLPQFPTFGLQVMLGLEKYFPVLLRSDHAPFWEAGIPSVMWTDTSEFRNPHYHQASDLPESLNYSFLRRVTQTLIATTLTYRSE